MGNANTSSKATGSNVGGALPQWAKTGTGAYNNMNSALQTLPMGAAVQTIGQGGMGATSQDAAKQLSGMGGSNAWMNQAAGSLQKPGAASDYLTATARGDFLNGSPYLDDIISKNSQDINDQTAQMFAAGGRYGSASHQGTLADSIGSMSSQLRNANYQSERDRQMGAANSLEAAQQGRASGLGALGQSSFNNQMQSLLGAAGLENQGVSNMLGMISQLPTIQGNKIFDAQQQQQVGGQIDQRAQQQLNDLINQWTRSDNEDWARLGGLISAGMGSAGNYGTQTGSQSTTQPANVAGILGGLLGLFSDRRLKSDIKRVGTLDNGLAVYSYRMGGGPVQIGVMADEVEMVRPEAVSVHESGFKMVRYDLATESA